MARRRSGGVTMVDVGRAAGCSQSTVSIVLNQTPGFNISPATQRKVIKAANRLGYVRPAPRAHGPADAGRQRGEVSEAPHPTASEGPTVPSTFAEHVSRSIGSDILSGRYQPGAVLPGDAELMAHFGVSRTALREALKVLSGKGLIRARARVGTTVRSRSDWHLFDPDVLTWQASVGLDPAFIASLGEVRMMLEPEAAALAATRRTDADVAKLYRCARRMGGAPITREDFTRADLDFHLTVAAAADNPFLRAVSTLIEVALRAALQRSWPANEPGGVERSAEDHAAIARAIENRQPHAARAAMRVVIAEGTRRATEPMPGQGHPA